MTITRIQSRVSGRSLTMRTRWQICDISLKTHLIKTTIWHWWASCLNPGSPSTTFLQFRLFEGGEPYSPSDPRDDPRCHRIRERGRDQGGGRWEKRQNYFDAPWENDYRSNNAQLYRWTWVQRRCSTMTTMGATLSLLATETVTRLFQLPATRWRQVDRRRKSQATQNRLETPGDKILTNY